jgi:hypothetical protein
MRPQDVRRDTRFVVPSEPRAERSLRCVECGTVSTGLAAGWKAYIDRFEADGEAPEFVVYCPYCAVTELDT